MIEMGLQTHLAVSLAFIADFRSPLILDSKAGGATSVDDHLAPLTVNLYAHAEQIEDCFDDARSTGRMKEAILNYWGLGMRSFFTGLMPTLDIFFVLFAR